MKMSIITKEEIKAVMFNKNTDIAIKHQNYFRVKSGKDTSIDDQTDFPKTKRRAIKIIKELEFNKLAYQIQLRRFNI